MNKKKIIIIVIILLIALFIGVFSFNILSKLNENPPFDNQINNNQNDDTDNSTLIPQKPSEKSYSETESSAIKNEPTIVEEKKENLASKEIKQKQYTDDKSIEVSNIKVSYDGYKYYLSFTVTNKSNNKYDLSKYNLYLYDKNKKVLATVDANILGNLSAKDSYAYSIEFETNISSITELDFVTK